MLTKSEIKRKRTKMKKTGKIDGCFKIGTKNKAWSLYIPNDQLSVPFTFKKKYFSKKLHFLVPSLREKSKHR